MQRFQGEIFNTPPLAAGIIYFGATRGRNASQKI
jgi:hypothetical protein